MSEQALREGMVRWGASLFQRGLTAGSSGNMSVKLDDGYLFTPTNSCLGFLNAAKLTKLDNSRKHVAGDPVVAGTSLEGAVYAIEELEEAAKLIFLTSGFNIRYLEPVEIAELKQAFPVR